MDAVKRKDVFGWTEELRQAIDEFRAEESGDAAYRAAAALGAVLLAGVEAEENLISGFDARMAIAAARHGETLVRQAITDTESLEERFDCTAAAENDVIEMIEFRMEIAQVCAAIERVWTELLGSDDPTFHELDLAENHLIAAINDWDDVLLEPDNFRVLTVVTSTNLLENWRRLFAPGWEESVMPWWLDGRIEDEAARVEREAASLMPSPEMWRQLKDQHYTRVPSSAPSINLQTALRRLPTPVSMAADTTTASGFIIQPWQSPDGRYRAELVCPMHPVAGQQVLLTVDQQATELPASELSGRRVRLVGIESQLDPQGRAEFSLEELVARSQMIDADFALRIEDDIWQELPIELPPEWFTEEHSG